MREDYQDWGKELNLRIKAARENVISLLNQQDRADQRLNDLLRQREEARKECNNCNDCSMCIP